MNSFGINLKKCNFDNKLQCTGDWSCAWCNTTDVINNTMSRCINALPVCGLNTNRYTNCSYNKMYTCSCYVYSTLFVCLLIFGYYISMIIIFGKLNKILDNAKVTKYTKQSINSLVLIVTITPLLFTFIFNPISFYFLFLSYISIGLCVSICIRIKRETHSGYTEIIPPKYST